MIGVIVAAKPIFMGRVYAFSLAFGKADLLFFNFN